MKNCPNCGVQLDEAVKFCPECGQKTEAAAASAIHVYGQPVNHSFSEPVVPETEQGVVHTYGAPVVHSFSPAVQADSALSGTYGGAISPEPVKPEPVPVAAPVAAAPVCEPIPAPAEPAVETGSYTPVAVAEEKKAKKEKTPRQKTSGGNKKPVRLILIGALALALIIGLISCIGGGGDKDDPNLGLYNGVSCSYGGFDLGADGEWIELKSGGKAKMMLMGEEYSAKWELDGEDLTVTQAGDTYYGTLKNGVLTLDLSDVIYVYEKEGAAEPPAAEDEIQEPAETSTEAPTEALTEPAAPADTPSSGTMMGDTVHYIAVSGNMSGVEMNDSGLEQMGGVKIVFNGDGTGTMVLFGQTEDITYDDTCIYRSGLPLAYTMDGENMIFHLSEAVEFTLMPERDALNRPKEELTVNDLAYWSGDYYGWWNFDNVIEGNASQGSWWDCCMTLDIRSDGTGSITIWDEDYGADDPIAEVEISASVYGGVARIVSEEGQFMGQSVEHADWLFYSDATDYEDTLAFFATYEDPDNKIDCFFFLRQWGTRWDEVEEKDRPASYESWYLPLIENGVTEAPDTIG